MSVELTAEQLELAAEALFSGFYGTRVEWELVNRKEACIDALREAAPFLQLPWDYPTKEECDASWLSAMRTGAAWVDMVVEFVRRRNAALLPKPKFVKPVEDLIAVKGYTFTHAECDAVLEHLRQSAHGWQPKVDEVKS